MIQLSRVSICSGLKRENGKLGGNGGFSGVSVGN